jgi:hypothetical protein
MDEVGQGAFAPPQLFTGLHCEFFGALPLQPMNALDRTAWFAVVAGFDHLFILELPLNSIFYFFSASNRIPIPIALFSFPDRFNS